MLRFANVYFSFLPQARKPLPFGTRRPLPAPLVPLVARGKGSRGCLAKCAGRDGSAAFAASTLGVTAPAVDLTGCHEGGAPALDELLFFRIPRTGGDSCFEGRRAAGRALQASSCCAATLGSSSSSSEAIAFSASAASARMSWGWNRRRGGFPKPDEGLLDISPLRLFEVLSGGIGHCELSPALRVGEDFVDVGLDETGETQPLWMMQPSGATVVEGSRSYNLRRTRDFTLSEEVGVPLLIVVSKERLRWCRSPVVSNEPHGLLQVEAGFQESAGSLVFSGVDGSMKPPRSWDAASDALDSVDLGRSIS